MADPSPESIRSGKPARNLAVRLVRTVWLIALIFFALSCLLPFRPFPMEIVALIGAQLAIALIGIGAVLFLLRTRFALPTALTGALVLSFCALRSNDPTRRSMMASEGASLRVVLYNGRGNTTGDDWAFVDWLLTQDADLVCLIDPPTSYLNRAPALSQRYPYRVQPEPGKWWGIVLLSKWPLEPTPLAPVTDEVRHSFIVRRSVTVTLADGRRLLFTGTHPPSPRSAALWRKALTQATVDGEHLRRRRASHGEPILVAGDFNSTVLGRVHQTFADKSGLTPWAPAVGGGTWPSWAPPSVSLAIDRFWASADIRFERVEVGPAFRSDHRPVVGDFRIGR